MFAEEGAPDRTIDALVATLARGFKDIVAMLNRGRFVITDWVPFRDASSGDESDVLASEAITFRGGGEGLDVVYVENAFFGEIAGSVLRGPANWTRILVHELSHLVCGTHDPPSACHATPGTASARTRATATARQSATPTTGPSSPPTAARP